MFKAEGNCLGDFVVKVEYTSKTELFSVRLPEVMSKMLGKDEVTSTTQKGCEDAFRKAVRDCRLVGTSKEKVILYEVELQGEVFRNGKMVFSSSGVRGFSDRCLAISVDFIVVTKCDTGDGRPYYCDLHGNSVSRGYDAKEMKWSQEREDFFKAVAFSFENLILKVDNFFKGDSKQLAKLLDTHEVADKLKLLSFFGGGEGKEVVVKRRKTGEEGE